MTNLPRERPRRKPRPRKIEGVTVQPTWQWSPWYTAHVKRAMREPPRRKAHHESDAIEYAKWLARRDGLDRFERADGLRPNTAECVWEYREYGKPFGRYTIVNGERVLNPQRRTRPTFIKAVEFYYQAPHQRGQYWTSYGYRGKPIERELIATIQIPNYDFQPTVTEGERPEERRAA